MKENHIATIVHNKIETPIEIISGCPVILSIESPSEFYLLVSELKSQLENGDGNFILIKDDKRLSLDKSCEIVFDVFDIDFKNKKIISALYKKLDTLSKEDELRLHLNQVNTCLAEFYKELFDKIELSLTFDEMDTTDILKTANVSLQETYDNYLEKLLCFINTMVQLKSIEVLVFVHLKSVLSDTELTLLYEHCEREKVGLLLIESSLHRKSLPNERVTIITEDLCEIVDSVK